MADVDERVRTLECQTQEKVSRSLSKIEVALAEWESAKKKPVKLKKRIERLKKTHKMLYKWEQDSLKGKKDLSSTMERLRKFTEICDELGMTG